MTCAEEVVLDVGAYYLPLAERGWYPERILPFCILKLTIVTKGLQYKTSFAIISEKATINCMFFTIADEVQG